MLLLAFETSCDETAVALFDVARAKSNGLQAFPDALLGEKVASQTRLHEQYGGVVPELASREHIKNLPILLRSLLTENNLTIDDISLFAVTRGPGLKGCLLVGMSFAKALAFAKRKPLICCNHIEGHIAASMLADNRAEIAYPSLSLVVSGGHTELWLSKEEGEYQLIARTRDDAAGEAFDKCATLIGLPYPGGPALSRLAKDGDESRYQFPRGVAWDKESFSFSGLKTAVSRMIETLPEAERTDNADLAASIQKAIVDSLTAKVETALGDYAPKSLIVTGGVAANPSLRESLQSICSKRGIACIVPPIKWCTDNAAMIAATAYRSYIANEAQYLAWDGSELGPLSPHSIDVKPRWPLSELN